MSIRARLKRLLPVSALLALLLLAACRARSEGEQLFQCPMHPQVVSDKPGDCPICGMRLVPKESHAVAKTPQAASTNRRMYRSTMNPSEVSDKPGKDSMGMEMVAVEEGAAQASGEAGSAPVAVSREKARLMGLTLGTVEKRRLERELRAPATVAADESRLHHVTTKVEGWVEHLYVNATGQAVRRGQPLLTLYSPELLASQRELLTALASAKSLAQSPYPSVADGGARLVEAARQRLRLWDVSEDQIARIERTGKAERTVVLYSPAGGYVMDKGVVMGHQAMPGEVLMTIADLSSVWVEVALYEQDLPYVQVGLPASLTLPYWPGREFEGAITFLSPFLDPSSRTASARLEVANRDGSLRPGMYGDAVLHYSLGEVTAVPDDAVMRTGEKTFVFREAADGSLAPVEVRVGMRAGSYYPVLSGLEPGERVVTSANFLIDSESELKSALRAVAGRE